ncbi:MAG: hypothetical protein JNL24_12435, partial [Bacteroidia bacterium]|nr:hypothetical protein [Bacteroidia bacterium]
MKNKLLTLTLVLLLSTTSTFAISYFSAGAGPADWNTATSWTPNGIPGQNDDVTISAGHTINFATNASKCRNLTIDGTLQWTSNVALLVYGTYTVSASGSEGTGLGKLQFYGSGNVTVNGVSNTKLYYNFISNRTITAGSVINKTNAFTQLGANTTVTNLGNFTIASFSSTSTSAFINGNGGVLNLKGANFMTSGTFNASTNSNTVNLNFTTGNVPLTTSGYYNLTLSGTSGVKTLTANTTVANNITISASNT